MLTPAHALMAVLFAAGLCITWFTEGDGTARIGAAVVRRLSWMEALDAVVVASISFVWLEHVNAAPIVSNEFFMLVVDCLLFGQCFTGGTGSSVLLDNGAVWPDILIAVRHFGGSAIDVYTVVIALLALGVALVFVVV